MTKIVFTINKPSINDLELSSSEVITALQTIHFIIHGFKHCNLQVKSEDYKIRMFNPLTPN